HPGHRETRENLLHLSTPTAWKLLGVKAGSGDPLCTARHGTDYRLPTGPQVALLGKSTRIEKKLRHRPSLGGGNGTLGGVDWTPFGSKKTPGRRWVRPGGGGIRADARRAGAREAVGKSRGRPCRW